jgi:hypothetical protein
MQLNHKQSFSDINQSLMTEATACFFFFFEGLNDYMISNNQQYPQQDQKSMYSSQEVDHFSTTLISCCKRPHGIEVDVSEIR